MGRLLRLRPQPFSKRISMSVLALITKVEEVALVVRWSLEFGRARQDPVTVLCWAESTDFPLLVEDQSASDDAQDLVDYAHRVIGELVPPLERENSSDGAVEVEVLQSVGPDSVSATAAKIAALQPDLLVAAADSQAGTDDPVVSQNPLLSHARCDTLLLYSDASRSSNTARAFVGLIVTAHDRTAVQLGAALANRASKEVTLALIEQDQDEHAVEVGRRSLQRLLRDVGVSVTKRDRIHRRVYVYGEHAKLLQELEKQDLVILGAGDRASLQRLCVATENPVIAVLKRAPPLRFWRNPTRILEWIPALNAKDYAHLVEGLRRGSRLNADFLIMLGLAAAIASLGLLQDSPAVVIGSMLLAPLMTPMVSMGLALAQANPRLGRQSLKTVVVGLLITLAIGLLTAMVTPGSEVTTQVLARGDPNILDLLIAVFSAAAAAYALSRPSVLDAAAGVAIATALVPPLCSLGIALAYWETRVAQGAGLLFITNFLAIALTAAGTFRLMGVTSKRAGYDQRRWVYRTVGLLALGVITLAIPLQRALVRNIDQGRPQPSTYPLTLAVKEALIAHLETLPDVELVAEGRPSSVHDPADVVIFLTSPAPLPTAHANAVVEIVRREMGDQQLIVEVHCLRSGWVEADGPTSNP